MSAVHRFTKFLLTHTPTPLRKSIRHLTPQWAYQAVVRSSTGRSFLAREPGQLFLSDPHVIRLEERLWQGFAHVAASDLEALLAPGHPKQQRAEAAMALARFHAANGAHADALERLRLADRLCPPLGIHRRARIIEIHVLTRLGRSAQARAVAQQALQVKRSNRSDLCVALASLALAEPGPDGAATVQAANEYLEGVSFPLETAGLVGLAMRDPSRPLAIDNLVAAQSPPAPESMPAKISVLMAVHNRRDQVPHAINSVLTQTWRNLELVIVDDASTDDSWDVIQRIAAQDERIVPIRQARNGGAYVARNTALHKASGEFVTVHDADDWSHPQKLEVQATALLRTKRQCGNTTQWFRVTPDMQAQPRLDLFQVPVIHKNFSSLMLTREKALELGGWDTVRMSADAEFVERLQASEGDDCLEELLPGVPLSLSLLEGGNLTTTSATGIRTSQFGARHAYARQYREWHRSGSGLRMSRTSQTSPFPVPGICLRSEAEATTFDTIVVSDFRDTACLSTRAGHAGNVALLPWPDYQSQHDLAVSDAVSRWCRDTDTVTLVHGEQAHCKHLLIDPARVMLQQLDQVPTIHADDVTLIDRDHIDQNSRAIIDKHVRQTFGTSPHWQPVPASAQ